MIKLITFLGNPGKQYEQTRHNVGWMVADEMSLISEFDWQKKFKGRFCQKNIGGNKVYFLKPETFMNKSGESVRSIMQFFKIDPVELLVVHDEIEMDFGYVGFKKGGGLAGHNGLRSISNLLGTRDFYRYRIGVSRPPHGNVSSYVLSKFSSDEQIVLVDYLSKAADLLELCFNDGFESVVGKHVKEKLA